MGEKRKKGLVSLEKVFDDLLKAEEMIKSGASSSKTKNIEQGILLLKEIKKNLEPLSEEKGDLDLDMIIEDIENAVLKLSEKPEIPGAVVSIQSARSNLIKYNLKGRKDF